MGYGSRSESPFPWSTTPRKHTQLPQNPPTKMRSSSPYVSSQAGLGYFAFPLPGAPLPEPQRLSSIAFDKGHEDVDTSSSTAADEEWEAEKQRQREMREHRISREAEEARRGEEEWVRSGGILRDSEGRRDYARTEAVKEELRLREEERKLAERWDQYELKWVELAKRCGDTKGRYLRFSDILWPVDTGGPVELADITVANVEEFLTAPLRIRGSKVTKKERMRNSVLRWHPDKMRGIVSRVVEEDVDKVEKGINLVTGCIQKIHKP